jgi:hypothetical protein
MERKREERRFSLDKTIKSKQNKTKGKNNTKKSK